jgi:hypothetical protein
VGTASKYQDFGMELLRSFEAFVTRFTMNADAISKASPAKIYKVFWLLYNIREAARVVFTGSPFNDVIDGNYNMRLMIEFLRELQNAMND